MLMGIPRRSRFNGWIWRKRSRGLSPQSVRFFRVAGVFEIISFFSVHSIALTIESALFGLFVMAISCDQVGGFARFCSPRKKLNKFEKAFNGPKKFCFRKMSVVEYVELKKIFFSQKCFGIIILKVSPPF